MYIICMDLEGILVPEIWINVAERTGIQDLRLTTRDISDYDQLMKGRLEILKKEGLGIKDIQDVIGSMDPLEGAEKFMAWLRERFQAIIVSDTFIEFAGPLLKKLNRPTLFCNSLSIGPDGTIESYKLRQRDGKRQAVIALKQLNYEVIAIGDSYNDVTMLEEANRGILFRPPDNIIKEFPHFSVFREYEDLKNELKGYT